MRELSYRIFIRPEPEGGYTVIVPSLPGCITYGETIEEAKELALDAIKAYLESLKKHGEDIPDDSATLEGMLSVKYA
ncbi:MAG: type II toxin-antitoxin system HicB family antitoxin [Actinomycetota bacterium]|nr:type II toxin-antitoxin system HicB family antitoxin [Actinomycetota bacterium]